MAFTEDKTTKLQGNHEVERENSRGENENTVAFIDHKSDSKTPRRQHDRRAASNFRHLVNTYHITKKNGFTVDRQSRLDDQDDSDTECESIKRRVALKEAESSESCVLSESANQTRRSYLNEGLNPLLDPRFTRLIEQLVPLRSEMQSDRNKLSNVRRDNLSDQCDEICFKDICLNETCRLVFKIMNKGNVDHLK